MRHFNQENGKKKGQNPAGGVSAVSGAVPDELTQAVEEMRLEAGLEDEYDLDVAAYLNNEYLV